ncbi:MAG: STAS domain-containing protein [Methylococcaceae bacterium]|nr:STAS domain-containing protein [Methylococcaceae bacterium]
MSTFTLSKQLDNHYFIDGDLTFLSINKKTMPSFDFLKQTNEIQIDLKKVVSADSAGLALLLEWIKHSKLYNTKLVFKNIPHQLLTLAALSGLDLNEYLTDID